MDQNPSAEALIESEKLYRELAERGCPIRMLHDLDGRILESNASAASALGRSSDELSSLNVRDILRPEALEGFHDYLRIIEAEGSAEGLMHLMTPAGELRVWRYRNTLHHVGFDRPTVKALAEDVTAHERELDALRRSEHRFRSIIENASDMIITVRRSGGVIYHSPATERLLGYTAEEIDGRNFTVFVHADDQPAVIEFFNTPADERRSLDVRLRHRDGSWRWFSVVASTIVNSAGIVRAIIVNGRDITERRSLEAQLEQAKRMASLGHLTATVAHEFNNVLMGMQPFADLMLRPGISSESVVKGARHIANSIARGKRVALDMLRFTRPAQPTMQPVAVDDWWDRLWPELQATLPPGIELNASFDECLILLADAAQVSQVFSNLVMNARDAMPRGGTISLGARCPSPGQSFAFGVVPQPQRFAHFTVTDTGAGMPEDVMRHAFDPLFTTKQIGGTGLGLAIVHQIVTKHEGFVFIESAVNAGSTFHVFLPLAERSVRVDLDEPIEAVDPILQMQRILIVEDEPIIGEGIAEALRDRGMSATVVETGGEAVAAALETDAEAAVIDIWLPDIDGIEVGLGLRALNPRLKIVFVSGHGNASHVLADCAPATFLQKPFTIRELLEALAKLERESLVT